MFEKKTFWGVLLAIWISGSVYWHICQVKQQCEIFNFKLPSFSGNNESKTAQLETSANVIISNPLVFTFPRSSEKINFTENQILLDSVTSFLKSNPTQLLNIKGFYNLNETNSTKFKNLGMARAFGIKSFLSERGIPDSVLSVSSDSTASLNQDSETIENAIKLTYSKREAITETDLANDERFSSIYNAMDLYFPYASTNYIKTPENQHFLNAAKEFLNNSTSKKLVLTGHTDNEDSDEWNMQLSIKRANVVKQKLATFGIPADKMIVIGKGESEPKASNSTIQGRRANRRVTIVVK